MIYAVFVNTTDTFKDCWIPFFTLFKKYWPKYSGKIYLNTEIEDFTFEGLQIICIKNKLRTALWADCLMAGLQSIKEDYLLYMQEDYFLKSDVDDKKVEELFLTFLKNKFDCLHLTDQCTAGPFNKKTTNPEIWEILPGAEYRISTQAAFWRRESLLQCLMQNESGWVFEKKASKRSELYKLKVYAVNQNWIVINKHELIPYIFTGIIRGKWKKEVISLFNENNIIIDYTIRGIYRKRYLKSLLNKLIIMLKLTKDQ